MDSSLPGSSVHGIFQARVLEWGATAFSVCPNLVHPKTETQTAHWEANCCASVKSAFFFVWEDNVENRTTGLPQSSTVITTFHFLTAETLLIEYNNQNHEVIVCSSSPFLFT